MDNERNKCVFVPIQQGCVISSFHLLFIHIAPVDEF